MDQLQTQTQQALQPQTQLNPQSSSGVPAPGMEDDDSYDAEIQVNLQKHLDNLQPELKKYLVENLDEKSVNILGIVNGQEVYDYFSKIYSQHIAPLKQQNSAPQMGMNPGQMPPAQPMAQSQPQ